MEVKAQLRYLRVSPRKVRLVADMIRKQNIAKARSFLTFTVNRPAEPLLKLLNSAVANAENNHNLKADNLYISEIKVDEGTKLKRWMPRARGSASPIEKKTSHITIILKEIEETKEKKKKKETKKDKIKIEKVEDIKDIKEIKEKDDKKKVKWEKRDNVKSLNEKNVSKKIFRRKSI